MHVHSFTIIMALFFFYMYVIICILVYKTVYNDVQISRQNYCIYIHIITGFKSIEGQKLTKAMASDYTPT